LAKLIRLLKSETVDPVGQWRGREEQDVLGRQEA
jgi:hypothetical protein